MTDVKARVAALGIDQDRQLGTEATPAAPSGLSVPLGRRGHRRKPSGSVRGWGGVQVHQTWLRLSLSTGGHQPLPDSGLAPAPIVATDVVSVPEATRPIPLREPRAQEMVDPRQETAEIGVRAVSDCRVRLSQTEENLDGVQGVTGHGGGR